MTTNITELAQRLKLEVHRAVSDFNPQMNIKTRDLKELVEALESEKRICATWRKTAEANSEKLEKAQQQMTESENRVRKQNRHICELFDDNTALRQRIAELESSLESADKLQDSAFRSGLRYGFSLGQTDDQKGYEQSMAACSLADGIKVEAE